MTIERRCGAEWMLWQLVGRLMDAGQYCHAEALKRLGRELLAGDDPADCVFPAAADLAGVHETATVRMPAA